MSARQHLGNAVLSVLPPTRAFPLKRAVLRWMGVDVAPGVRVAFGLRVLGNLRLSIGRDTFVGHECLISGGVCKVRIGSRVDIAPRVTLVPGTHEVNIGGDRAAGQGMSRDIVIHDGAWIGAGATILGGVTIGECAVVAAGSVVTTDIPARCVAAGVPCRVKKSLNGDRAPVFTSSERGAA